jgi:hypothetical protein
MARGYALIHGNGEIVIVDGNGKDGIVALLDFLAARDEGYGLVQGSRL